MKSYSLFIVFLHRSWFSYKIINSIKIIIYSFDNLIIFNSLMTYLKIVFLAVLSWLYINLLFKIII